MISFQVKGSGNLGIVTLKGELTADRADELRDFLRRAFDQVNHVVLNLENVTMVDISCLHWFCSAHRMALMWKKCLTLAGNWTELFKRAIKTAGSLRCTNCSADGDTGCVWKTYVYDGHYGQDRREVREKSPEHVSAQAQEAVHEEACELLAD